jgi:pilus assembly protein TadC
LVAAGIAGEAVNGSSGAAAGLVVGFVLSRWLGHLESPEVVRARDQIAHDLPLAIDLMAACAAAGHPSERVIAVVSRSVGGPLAERLDRLSARFELGADPLTAWRSLTDDPQLAPLARTMMRALESGAPISQALSRLADDNRRRRRTTTQQRARSVGVKSAGPLALCFLPAFMVLGVVPTVVGAFSHLGW